MIKRFSKKQIQELFQQADEILKRPIIVETNQASIFEELEKIEEEADSLLESKSEETIGDYIKTLMQIKGIKRDVALCRRSNITSDCFSKIKNNRTTPTKNTLAAICFGLGLNVGSAQKLLHKAGYHLSNTNRFDLAIGFFLEKNSENKSISIEVVNMYLYERNFEILGTKV